jgi:hypothetical protein
MSWMAGAIRSGDRAADEVLAAVAPTAPGALTAPRTPT